MQLFPHISHVMNKYKHKIPRDDLKRFAKEIAKKLVASDYKAGRVKDPTKIDERQQKKVKEFCKQFFEKAYQKHKKYEAEKAAREKGKDTLAGSPPAQDISPENDNEDIKMSDIEDNDGDVTPGAHSPAEGAVNGTLKRKRLEDDNTRTGHDQNEAESLGSPSKKLNLDVDTPPPPPPPPAPPVETPPASTPREVGGEGYADPDTDIHADTNFKGKSMADVLAEAQAEDEEIEGDVVMKNGVETSNDSALENPLVDVQPVEDPKGVGDGAREQ